MVILERNGQAAPQPMGRPSLSRLLISIVLFSWWK